MKKRVIIPVISTMIAAVLTMLLLVLTTETPNDHKNGFARKWGNAKPILINQESGFESSIKVCGATDQQIYLTGVTAGKLWVLDNKLKVKDSIVLKLSYDKRVTRTNELIVDGQLVKIALNNRSEILNYSPDDKKLLHTVKLEAPLFSRIALMTNGELVIRAFSKERNKQVFQTVNGAGKLLQENTVLNTEKDAGLATDGYLRYDASSDKIYYIQAYQNRFFAMDRNLKVLFSAKTVDTTNANTMNPKLFDQNALKSASAIRNVNLDAYAAGGKVYVLSGLKADNEKDIDFKNNAVIDVYNGTDGKYLSSFHIPNVKDQKIRSFRVMGNTALVVYKGTVAKYKLN